MKNISFVAFIGLLLLANSCNTNQKTSPELITSPVSQLMKIDADDTKEEILIKAAHVVPSPIQMAYLEREFAAMICLGPNTFSRREWGDGFEAPDLFNPSSVDTDQWCKTMKEVGIKSVVFIAKHHEGYCLWQTRYTEHSVAKSPWKNGQGDVVKDLSESCKKYGLKLGIYLSPADLFQIESSNGLYGNGSSYSKRTIPKQIENRPFTDKRTFTYNVDDYNEYFMSQLFELLTEYGPVHEIWFDGAHPKRKGGQVYANTEILEMIRELAPEAAIFGRTDVRWCGNEGGFTRLSEWNVIPLPEHPDISTWPDLMSDKFAEQEHLMEAKYLYYMPAEVNTSIRAGWFFRDDIQKTRTVEDVFDIYERAVGGNAVFMLNIPPNREGRFADADVEVLHELSLLIDETYGNNLIEGSKSVKAVQDQDINTFWAPKNKQDALLVSLKRVITINRFCIQESIEKYGQRIERIILEAEIEGEWKEIANATTVGYKKILRFPEVTAKKFRLTIPESRHSPTIAEISAHYAPSQLLNVLIEKGKKHKIHLLPHWNDSFAWKRYEVQKRPEVMIRYTTDGSEPGLASPIYSEPLDLPLGGQLKARVSEGEKLGPLSERIIGIDPSNWTVKASSSESERYAPDQAIDGINSSCWQSKEGEKMPQYLSINLGKAYSIKGFIYLPRQGTKNPVGMIEEAYIEVSRDGLNWQTIQDVKFGNILNDPVKREVLFAAPVEAKFFRISVTKGPLGSTNVGIAEIEVLAG